MKFMLDINIKPPARKIGYTDKLVVIGSCFTEHIGGRLQDVKFDVLQNPNGILFDPLSVASAINSYIRNKPYGANDLFQLNELWQSWNHHSRFSGLRQTEVLHHINSSQQQAHNFIKKANWLVVTLGSAFSYQLADSGRFVANCHRAPGRWFKKHLVAIDTIISELATAIENLLQFNPTISIIFTISPVRHIRDGVVENNRSKARLIEAVHHLTERFAHSVYFPAYELVIDVLRDYRYYDIDLVHPNYPATEFVFEKFTEHYIDPAAVSLMNEVKQVVTASKHRPFQPESTAHQAFLKKSVEQAQQLQKLHPYLQLQKEIDHLKGQLT